MLPPPEPLDEDVVRDAGRGLAVPGDEEASTGGDRHLDLSSVRRVLRVDRHRGPEGRTLRREALGEDGRDDVVADGDGRPLPDEDDVAARPHGDGDGVAVEGRDLAAAR